MRTSVAIAIFVGVVVGTMAGAHPAQATECTAGPKSDPFPICFDPGNRLVLQLGYRGSGGEIALRHYVGTDDPGIYWRLEHGLLAATYDDHAWRGALYRGRFLRHSRDGHIVLPTSPPRKLFLPFDIGGEADFGAFVATPGQSIIQVGVVRAALLVEVSRSGDFRRRLAVGVAARWDATANVGRGSFDLPEQLVAPFSLGVLGLHLESNDGLSVLDVDVEGGTRWSSVHGFGGTLAASAGLERVVIAVNDRPLSLYCQAGWEDPGRGAWLTAGLRFALVASTPTRR